MIFNYSPQLHRAISLALCLVDFEREQPQVRPIPEEWDKDLELTREALTDLHRQFEKTRMAGIERQWSNEVKNDGYGHKRQAVEALLVESPGLTDTEIARRVGCSQSFASRMRRQRGD